MSGAMSVHALMVLEREQVKIRFMAEERTTHGCVRTAGFVTQPGFRMHRGVEIHSGKRDPHGTADVVERCGMPPCPLENRPGNYKSHGTYEIQPCSRPSYIENMFGCGDSEAALSIGWFRRHVGVKAPLKTPCVTFEGGWSRKDCANIVVKIEGVELA